MIEGINFIEHVEKAQFSEYVHILDRRSYEEVEADIIKRRGT